ncbi:hypothetical protein DESHY_70001 [Desulforamulus hydrothermalis Lam5 = DSM 18033]|uniref:Uncharacterized protein n=2 Tax=Desulforamulus TaxID=2916693 RepID=K8E0W5_9FIRM|nr:hypothetical protein DESHY_70001 [Desulforamulus hydrothermalis Lam5 = DSM 18033]
MEKDWRREGEEEGRAKVFIKMREKTNKPGVYWLLWGKNFGGFSHPNGLFLFF